MNIGEVWAWACSGGLVLVMFGLPFAAWRARSRWGKERHEVAVGAGAYRAGTATVEEPRGVPSRVVRAAILSGLWALVTFLVFVPGGAFATILLFERGRGGAGSLAGAGSVIVTASGLAIAIELAATARALVRRSDGAKELARWVVRHSTYHHVGVVVVYTAGLFAMEDANLVAIAALFVPCGLGLLVGREIEGAIAAIAALDLLDGPDALPAIGPDRNVPASVDAASNDG